MSTDRQDTSIAIQKMRLKELAEREGYEIIQSYSDEGCSGSRETAKRTDWLKLLASSPTAEWEVVLCYNRSRFSRLDSIEEGFAKQTLREAGKRLHTAVEGPVDWETSTGRIIDTIHSEASNDYAAKVGYTTLEGKLNSFLRSGTFGQKCPYGMSRRLVDQNGQVHMVSRKEKCNKPRNWTQTFVPGDPVEVEAVRWLFQTYATKDVGYRWMARQLNAKGIPSASGVKWCAELVRRILLHRVYIGASALGKTGQGRFARLQGDQIVKSEYGKGVTKKQAIIREGIHQGIVDRELWDLVQAKIERHAKQAPHKSRGEGGYALLGILFCGHCGKPLYGRPNIGAKGSHLVTYTCKNALNYGSEIGCRQWMVRETDMLELIIDRLTKEVDQRMLAANSVRRPTPERQLASNPAAEFEKKLKDLDRKITVGAERFLLAPDDLVPEIRTKLDEWKAERTRVAEQIEEVRRRIPRLETALKEWQQWFRAIQKKLIVFKAGPADGKTRNNRLAFTPEAFRETLRRFGCRVYCWWRQVSQCRWSLDRVRMQLGAILTGNSSVGSAAPNDTNRSEMVWCGDRNGRMVISGSPGGSRPRAL
jgi:DNA invertase Pin-like site-specific DNA recombinase